MKKWLNKVIKLQKKLCKLSKYKDADIRCVSIDDYLHINENIEDLAKAVGKDITITTRNCDMYPIKKSFNYKGMEIFQIGTKEGKQ